MQIKANSPAISRILIAVYLLTGACQFPSFSSTRLAPSENRPAVAASYFQITEQPDLSLVGLTSYFPRKINGKKRSVMHVRREDKTAVGVYGNREYSISITDDTFQALTNIAAFQDQYSRLEQLGQSKDTLAAVLDGYKTITQIEVEKVSIRFIFKNRYLIEVSGFAGHTPYQTWQFIPLNAFSKLPGLPSDTK